jgi:hypothetical protein
MRLLYMLMVVALLALFLGTGVASAVGYDRYEVDNGAATKSAAKPGPSPDLGTAVREASLLDRCPAVIDQVVFFVKDILGQFGITKPKAP